MFWNRKHAGRSPVLGDDQRPEAALESGRVAQVHEGEAIDTVATILRVLGRYSFDLSADDPNKFGKACEAWAEHVSVGAPHPERGPEHGADWAGQRDWAGARRFVLRRRQAECSYVATALTGLRDVIWDLTERLARMLVDDQRNDEEVVRHVEKLRSAVALDSIELMRREVEQVAEGLARIVEGRRRLLQGELRDLGARVGSLRDQLEEAKQESNLDGLTRLFNRAAFERALQRMHQLGTAFGQDISLILVDVDHFKAVNDRHGHPGGDAALKAFADCLVRNFPRRSDFLGRYGGDEFVIILPETPLHHAARLAERFVASVRDLDVEHRSGRISLTASVGLAELGTTEDASTWIERADRALYEAKAQGRDRLVVAA